MYLLFFLLGNFSMFTQTILLRELLVVALGNEIIFGISFTHWLLGITIGAAAGGMISDKLKKPLSLLTGSVQLMCVIAPVLIYAIRLFYKITGTTTGTFIGFFDFFIHASWMIIPFSFFVGFTMPLASRCISGTGEPGSSAHQHITRIYIFEAIGFLAGGILFTFFLSGKSNPFILLAVFSIPLILWTVSVPGGPVLRFISAGLLAVMVAGLLPAGFPAFHRNSIQQRWSSRSRIPLLISTDSRYQNLALGKNEDQFNLYSNGQLSMVFPEHDDNLRLAAHLMCQHPDPKHILIIGEAISGLGAHLLTFNPDSIMSVEIDPAIIRLINNYLPEKISDRRFSQLVQDERYFVKKYARKTGNPLFDLVFLNIPEPATLLLNRFYTIEFFRDIRKILSPDGVLALRITSSENYAAGFVSEYTASIFHTMRSVFPHLVVAPGEQNFFFASPSSRSITDSPGILESRYMRSGVEPRHLGLLFYSLYPGEKTRYINDALTGAGDTGLNSDNTPVSIHYFNKILGWYSGNNLEGIFSFFSRITPMRIFILLLLMVAGRIIYIFSRRSGRKGRSRKCHVLTAVVAAGFSGMSMELFYIYTFQNDSGYVYQFIGFIIALFMLGLPIGAAAAGKLIFLSGGEDRRHIIILLVTLTVLGIIILLFPSFHLFVRHLFLKKILTLTAAIMTGILVGSVFPTALTLLLKDEKTGGPTGWIDASDHGGAAMGALVAGTILLPVLGLSASCLFISGILFLSVLLLGADLITS